MKNEIEVEQNTVDRADARFILFSGVAGVIGILGYVTGIAVEFDAAAPSLVAIALFCILGIVANVGLRDAVAGGNRSRSAEIGLILSVPAFATLLCMAAVQLAVRTHARSMLEGAAADQKETLRQVVQLTRQVDWGLDVAWDLMGGAFLLAFGIAMCFSRRFRLFWGLPLIGLSVALLVLNIATFPVPPASAGLFDIGPFIGLYMLAVSIRVITIGAQMLRRPEMSVSAAVAPAT